MSYILDALRKAEHERSIGDAPRLTFSPLSEKTDRKPLVLWSLVAMLGIAVGILGAMQFTGDKTDSVVVEKPAAVQQPAKSATPKAEKPAPRVVVVAPVKERAAIEPKPTSRPVQVNTPHGPIEVEMPMSQTNSSTQPKFVKAPVSEEKSENRKAPQVSPVKKAKTAPVTPAASVVAAPESEPVSESEESNLQAEILKIPSPADLAAEYEEDNQFNQSAEPSVAASEPATEEPEPEPEQMEIKTYYGLPSSTRNSIGDLAMNAHVYSSTPGRGFVMINGSRYRAGERLSEGPTLVEILQDGALLDYRGQLFLLPVPR